MTIPRPLPLFSLAADFAAGNDTPRDFLERRLACLETFEPAVGAFVCHDVVAARAAADRSAALWRDARPLSPIDGMPLGIKDIIETVDILQTRAIEQLLNASYDYTSKPELTKSMLWPVFR